VRQRTKLIIGGAVVTAEALGVASATGAAPGPPYEEVETPITGSALEKAGAAALAHLGEGRVTETEVGDEESYYEVEVRLSNGKQVDVQLDEAFNVVGIEDDGVGEAD
jgi:uncharacterized membrane protein YkoI